MFKATKPFNDKVTNYPKEPSLRIGRCVPENAVNLAYYYNPTATDAEKVLAAEAPRQTIDHRVEEAYRYLFDQASDDDNLFPGSVLYEDEEGYQGRLGRMYVNWYPEAHIETKNVSDTRQQIVTEKNNVLKMIEYSDNAGFTGNLYLDGSEYEVSKTKTIFKEEKLPYTVNNHELSYRKIFDKYISPQDLDNWMKKPDALSDTMWSRSITVDTYDLTASGGNGTIVDYVANSENIYDEAIGQLVFDRLEYEQVEGFGPTNGSTLEGELDEQLKSDEYKYQGDVTDDEKYWKYVTDCKDKARKLFLQKYEATYNQTDDKYDYTEINKFINMGKQRGGEDCN